MRGYLIRFLAAGLPALLLLACFEVTLRLFPSLIGIAILDRFHPDLGATIAGELGFSTMATRLLISSAERLDKGPDFYIYLPNSRYVAPIDPADVAYGAVDYVPTDNLGFCNPPGAAARGYVDIVAIGGSVPNCVGVPPEHIFTNELARLTHLTAYNIGANRTGPNEYLELLRRYGLRFRPRAVVMNISEANDLRDISRYNQFVTEGVKQESWTRNLGGLFRYSYAFAFLKGGIEFAVKAVKAALGPDFRYTVRAEGKDVALNIGNSTRDELQLAHQVAAGTVSPDIYGPALKDFVTLAGKSGFTPVVVLVPAAYTIYDKSIVFNDPSIAPDIRAYHSLQRDWLAANAARIGYRFIDATAGMMAAAESGPLLYFPANVHLTAAGHAALAATIAPELRSVLSVP